MQLAEIRDLDGPNLFALEPVIKLEIRLEGSGECFDAFTVALSPERRVDMPAEPVAAITKLIQEVHAAIGLTVPELQRHQMDSPDHLALTFEWQWRKTGLIIAETAFLTVQNVAPDVDLGPIRLALAEDRERDNRPTWVRDEERTARTIAVTGTNGKTTTTRLLAHILRTAGLSTGWSSSSGVYINGEMVLEGDYTGHGGARRVLIDPTVEAAVLESARGGILLRGLGYESNDVGVFLNVSADHIGLHGVTRLETLARVKSTVVRTTRADGVAVLNADDDLVMSQAPSVKAEIWLISQDVSSPRIQAHADAGGQYLVREGDQILVGTGHDVRELVSLEDVPLTYAGTAKHMVENALAASAAALGLGLNTEQVRDGLATFEPDPEHNAGRLNVFEIEGRTVVVDYAHNESGLLALIEFARARFPDKTSITAVIGTAGDRGEEVFRGLGRIAAEHADRIILKQNPGYLRGRDPNQMLELMAEGVRQQNAELKLAGTFPSEYDATFTDLRETRPGDVLVIMCVEDFRRVIEELQRMTAEKNRTQA